jgi:hypothetical protein
MFSLIRFESSYLKFWNWITPLLLIQHTTDPLHVLRSCILIIPESINWLYVTAVGCSLEILVNTCKIWGFNSSDCEEFLLLRYKNQGRTSQETYYVSSTEPSRLMLCQIWRFHGGDCDECRLLGHKNPLRTSQETHYISGSELSRSILCKTWSFHGNDYGECRLLGCYAMWLL